MMISLIIPAYNEEKRIYNSLVELTNYMNKNFYSYEIICVVDGTDKTGEIVRNFAIKNQKVKIIEFEKRIGKGKAIQIGIRKSVGNKIIIIDSDIPVSLNLISRFVNLLETCDLVISKRLYRYPFHRKIASKIWNIVCNLLFFDLKISDIQAGFKGMKRESAKVLFKNLKIRGYGWDVEILLKARKYGFRIKEYPLEFFYRKGSKVKFFVDGALMFLELMKLKIFSKKI